LAHGFEISSPVECISTKQKQFDKVSGDIPTGNIETTDQMRESETFVNRDDVGYTVTGVDNDTSLQAYINKKSGYRKGDG
jgi:hypothetical protein